MSKLYIITGPADIKIKYRRNGENYIRRKQIYSIRKNYMEY